MFFKKKVFCVAKWEVHIVLFLQFTKAFKGLFEF